MFTYQVQLGASVKNTIYRMHMPQVQPKRNCYSVVAFLSKVITSVLPKVQTFAYGSLRGFLASLRVLVLGRIQFSLSSPLFFLDGNRFSSFFRFLVTWAEIVLRYVFFDRIQSASVSSGGTLPLPS